MLPWQREGIHHQVAVEHFVFILPVGKGFQGQATAGWSRWDTRTIMMENHKLSGLCQAGKHLPHVFWAMGTDVSEKSRLGGLLFVRDLVWF